MKFFDFVGGLVEADTMTMMPTIKGMRASTRRAK